MVVWFRFGRIPAPAQPGEDTARYASGVDDVTTASLTVNAAPAPVAGTQTRILDNWDAFQELAEPWDELAAAAGVAPFVSHRWLTAWQRAYGHVARPCMPTVWRDGQLVAAAPLGATRRALSRALPGIRLHCLEMLTNTETAAFCEWLVAPGHEDTVAILLRTLAQDAPRWRMAQLELMKDTPTLALIRAAARDAGWPLLETVTAQSATMDLSSGWDGYLANRPTRYRRGIQRYQRRLKKREHRFFRGTENGDEVLERIFRLTRKSWKAQAGTALANSEAAQTFFRELWAAFGPTDEMQLHLLQVEDTDAGSMIALRGGESSYGLKMDFDEAYKDLSAGRLAAADWLESSAAAGLREGDFLRLTSFSKRWADGGYDLTRLRLFPGQSAAAWWYRAEEAVRPIGREWRAERRKRRNKRTAYK